MDLTFNISNLLGANPDYRRTKVWLETNIPDDVIVDSGGNEIRLGTVTASVGQDGTGVFEGVIETNALTNPTNWQYQAHVDYPDTHAPKGRASWASGWFSLNVVDGLPLSVDLSDVAAEVYVPPTYSSTLMSQLDAHEATLEGDLTAHAAGLQAPMDAAVTDAQTAEANAEAAAVSAQGIDGVGTVTSLAPGATPTASITGTPPARIINFGIPAAEVDDASLTALDANAASAFRVQSDARLAATIGTATRPTNAVNPITGWYHVKQYGAVGDGTTSDTAAIAAAIAAIPSGGGVLFFERGTYACANLTLNKDNLSLLFHSGARLKKNANGPVLSWGSGGFTKLDCQNLRIDGEGGTYTGAGLVINGGTWPRLSGGEIINTASNPIQFVGDGAGHSSRISDMILFPINAQVGGANENVGAVLLPLDATQAPNRHFVNIHTAAALLFDDAGSQDSNWVGCTARNILNSGQPAKQYLVSCRIASAAATVTLRGDQCMWVGSAFAGPIVVHGSSSNCTLTGNVGAGDLTIASGAAGTAVGGNTITGSFYDYGLRTRIAGLGMDGTYPPPHTIDPRSLSAATALNANQAVYLRVRSRGYVTKVGIHVGTSSGNICVGVYKNNGSTGTAARPDTRKATSGSVACPAAGYAEVALTSTVYVDEGDWLAIVADNATATFYRGSAAAFGSNLANGVSHHQSSAFPLPSTASPGTGTLFSVVLTGVN